MGETRVDLLHLLEDLRDAYPGSLEETLLTEIVANSLDSGASRIAVAADPSQNALLVADDGAGMQRRELARFHDIAASRKTRGEGIGFAGVGIKLALLASEEVVTETRRGKTHVATRWSLASRRRAPWKWIPPPGLVGVRGTAVSLKVSNPLSPLTDGGFLEATLRSHFQPFFETDFEEVLSEHYPRGLSFLVNGRRAEGDGAGAERAGIALRLSRKRKPSAVGYLERSFDGSPLPPERRGIGISAFGKVIKRGWDWLGIMPQSGDRFGGLIEAPGLAGSLTLNKTDFIRVGPRGAIYLAYRKAIQEAVTRQLSLWGDGPEAVQARERRTRPLERDLETVLMDLAEEFPLLEALVDKHLGGQKRLPTGRPAAGKTGAAAPAALEVVTVGSEPPSEEPDSPPAPSQSMSEEKLPSLESPVSGAVPQPGSSQPRRPGRYGLAIQFENRPESGEMGRLAEAIVWVNEAHPAYRRAIASRSEGYHIALAAALALSKVAVEPSGQQAFLNAFFARWGEALSAGKRPGRRK